MGTRVAPSLANIFMSDFEEEYVYTYPKQPFFWKRFLDDIIMVWLHGREELDKFIDHLNSCHSTIKFTAEISSVDTTLHVREDGKLWTDLYCKPTDSHAYLHYTSAHPYHCKRSLPYSQFLRIKRICSRESDYLRHSITQFCHFIRRGYPFELIQKAFVKASTQTREDLLNKQRTRLEETTEEDSSEQNLFLITTFDPESDILGKMVRENWDLLKRSAATKILAETRLITGYRRPPNLKDLLVRARVPQITQSQRLHPCSKFSNRCNNKKCKFCPLLNKTGRITSTNTGREYEAKKNVTCKSSNLIYCITCKRCKKQYVGQTGNTLYERFGAHSGAIGRNKLTEDVSRHFSTNQHNGLSDMGITIVDFIFCHPKSNYGITLRLQIEFNWIQRLRTMLPMGLNTKDRTPLETYCRNWKTYRDNSKIKVITRE